MGKNFLGCGNDDKTELDTVKVMYGTDQQPDT